VDLLAHIGNVPVEEWLPFLVPVVALYLYGRHRDRRRRAAPAELPGSGEPLSESSARQVLAQWSAAEHEGLQAEDVALFCPPGPEGLTAAELGERADAEPAALEAQLARLEGLGYVELEQKGEPERRRVWLTLAGYDLVVIAESALGLRGARLH
jgi:DNA-binding transcriptional ArsR family regulator